MTKIYITAIEAEDEAGELVFTAKMFDASTVEILLKQTTNTAESWRELAADVGRAIEMFGLKTDDKVQP